MSERSGSSDRVPLPGNLQGRWRVRRLREAEDDVQHWLPRVSDRMILRDHVLSLAYWPAVPQDERTSGCVDLNWDWIRALPGERIGELRIGETIGGCDDLRVIFWVQPEPFDLPTIHILAVFQKKRDDFTRHQIHAFRNRRDVAKSRL